MVTCWSKKDGRHASEQASGRETGTSGVEPVKQQVREERSGAYVEVLEGPPPRRADAQAQRRLHAGRGLVACRVSAPTARSFGGQRTVVANFASADVGSLYVVRYQSRLSVAPLFYPLSSVCVTGSRQSPSRRWAAWPCAPTSTGRRTESTTAQLVSGEFSTLQLRLRLGRLLTSTTPHLGGHPIVGISSLLARRFGGTDDVLGKSLTFNGARLTIVGVAPEGFSECGSRARSTRGCRSRCRRRAVRAKLQCERADAS